MNRLRFALKRGLGSRIFLLFFFLLLLSPLAYSFGRELEPLPSGCCIEGTGDEAAQRLQTLLAEAGFQVIDSPKTLRQQVEDRLLDTGILIPGELSSALEKGELKEVLGFIKAPQSLLPDLAREQAAAALFLLYAPYITAESLKDSGISREEVLAAFAQRLGEGDLFRLELSRERGIFLPDRQRSRGFYLGALSLLLFTGVYFALLEPLEQDLALLSQRLPASLTLGKCFLPGLFLRSLLLLLAVLPGLLLLGEEALLLPLTGYLASLLGLGLLFTALPGRDYKALVILLLAGLALPLCPIYTDLSLLYPQVTRLRFFLPPYLLWVFLDRPLLIYPAATLLLLGIGVTLLRGKGCRMGRAWPRQKK